MSKKHNAWMAHVMRTKAANPGMQLKDVLRKAGETYKKDSGASASASSSASASASSSSSSSTKHKSHKKHGGLLPIIPLLGGRKRRGGEGEIDAVPNAAETNAAETVPLKEEEVMAGGGPLSPADVSGMKNSSGTALQLKATAYSGGKKSRRKGSRSRSRSRKGSHNRKGSHKRKGSRSHKRRGGFMID